MEQEQYRGLTLVFEQDTDVNSPREECDHLGTMVCWHRRECLGDEGWTWNHRGRDGKGQYPRFSTPKDYEAWKQEQEAEGNPVEIELPLALLDHSGLHMWVGKGPHAFDPGGWDSGQVGWIFLQRRKLLEEYSREEVTPDIVEKAEEVLHAEVEEYNQWLNGDVWCWAVEDHKGMVLDSCCGFYGGEYAREQAMEAADGILAERERERQMEMEARDGA